MTPSYLPTAQQELLLQAALLPDEAGRAAWRRIHASTAFEALDNASQSLLPLVYRNLAAPALASAMRDRCPEGAISLHLERQPALLPRSFFPCCGPSSRPDRCRRPQGIGPDRALLPRSGSAAHGRRGCARAVPSDVERASELAVGLGWHPRHRLTPAFLRAKHAGPFDHPTGVACDLHWRVFEEAGGGRADDEFRAAAEWSDIPGGSTPNPLADGPAAPRRADTPARWGEVPGFAGWPMRW